MKIYRGKWKYARRHYKGFSIKRVMWGLSLKPGDYFASCVGHNRCIASIRVIWRNDGQWYYERTSKNWFIHDIEITDTLGRLHYVNAPGCAVPAESNEIIMNNYREWVELDHYSERMEKITKAVKAGIDILNEHGELLSEFQ